ncbi:MAG TPA: hypothetical protein PLO89_02905 [Spirochaetota bacterium]|nr:hypothetical protein [Spirochaetota bacterium]
MSIPIIFVHRSNSDYLKYSLSQAKYFSPNSEVILIGDESNDAFPFIRHFLITDYFESAANFAKIYEHLSFNDRDYELFCFQRWFIIKDFIEKNGINDFLYLDSDTLLFCDANEEFVKYRNYDFTICNKMSPQFTYFSSRKSLVSFCAYVENLYSNEKMRERLLAKFKKHRDENLSGGVCDMTAFREYNRDYPNRVFEALSVVDNSTFDNNLNFPEGYEFDVKNNIKKVYYKRKLPYCKSQNGLKIRFKGLHCQGGAKKLMYKLFRGKNYFSNYLKIEINNFYNEVKNKIRLKSRIKKIFGG